MASELPPAPQIPGEAMLEIFVHRSMRNAGVALNPNSPYADGARLATIGSRTLEAAYAYILFRKKPMMTAMALNVRSKFGETFTLP